MEEQRRQVPALTDFDIFDRILARTKPPPSAALRNRPEFRTMYEAEFEDELIEIEARHFLVGALSHLDSTIVRGLPLRFWRWTKWFASNSQDIAAIASFNYDLVVERTLLAAGLSYRRPSINPLESGRVVVCKPHGSIDFGSQGISMPFDYPLRNAVSRNDFPIQRIEDLGNPRLDAEIVLPAEASSVVNFQWVAAARTEWGQAAGRARDLVLAGLSYWPCDREELDGLVNVVPTGAQVHVCNPVPNQIWIDQLKARFGPERVTVWSGPPAIL